ANSHPGFGMAVSFGEDPVPYRGGSASTASIVCRVRILRAERVRAHDRPAHARAAEPGDTDRANPPGSFERAEVGGRSEPETGRQHQQDESRPHLDAYRPAGADQSPARGN